MRLSLSGDVESNPSAANPTESNRNCDIEINPGPGFSAPKCTVCEKVVKINNKHLICSMCFDVVHAKCSKQPSNHTIQARIQRYYTCNRCLYTQLPFFNISNLDSSYDMCNTTNDNSLSIPYEYEYRISNIRIYE